MKKIGRYKLPEGRSLGLKVVHKDGRPESPDAPKDFRWNLTPGGETVAPDWDSTPKCGGGLHVWAWAQGRLINSRIWNTSKVVWLAVEYETTPVILLDGCVKIPKCSTVAISTNRKAVVSFIRDYAPSEDNSFVLIDPQKEVFFEEANAADVASVGDGGKVIVGNGGIAEAGDGGKAIAGAGGTAVAGVGGEALSGLGGRSQVGDLGTAIAGHKGTAIAGYRGVAVAGDEGKVFVGFGGKGKAGARGVISFGGYKKYKVDRDLIKPDTFYELGRSGVPREVKNHKLKALRGYRPSPGCSFGLKVVHPGGVPETWNAPNGFRWNLELGCITEAPDWNPKPVCGGGLHLWAWGQGDVDVSRVWLREDAVWMAVEYETSSAVDLKGKIKVPKARTIAVSADGQKVIAFIQAHTPENLRGPVLFEERIVECGKVDVGSYCAAIVQGDGYASAGIGGYAEVKGKGTAIVLHQGTAIVGEGWADAGFHGTAEAGSGGRATAGDYGTARAGTGGIASAGKGGIAEVGLWGRAKAGVGGKIVFPDRNKEFLVGENGVKPNAFYELNPDDVPVEIYMPQFKEI